MNAVNANLRFFWLPLLVLALLVGCGRSPTEVLHGIEDAARAGDDARFASFFTEDSAPFARALLSVYRTQAPGGGALSKPLDILTASVVVSERVDGARAFLTVRTGEATTATSSLVFVKDGNGDWKMDIHQTEKANSGRE